MEHTDGALTTYHRSAPGAELETPTGNANYLGVMSKDLNVVAEIANTRHSPFRADVQDANARHLAHCWNLFYPMWDFIISLENDDNTIPEFMWKARNRLIKKAQEK